MWAAVSVRQALQRQAAGATCPGDIFRVAPGALATSRSSMAIPCLLGHRTRAHPVLAWQTPHGSGDHGSPCPLIPRSWTQYLACPRLRSCTGQFPGPQTGGHSRPPQKGVSFQAGREESVTPPVVSFLFILGDWVSVSLLMSCPFSHFLSLLCS